MKELILQRYSNQREEEVTKITLYGDIPRVGNSNYISDGGDDDMFDGANFITTNLYGNNNDLRIPYTHTQNPTGTELIDAVFPMDGEVASGSDYFGEDSRYFTNCYPGLFVLSAAGIDIEEFKIDGNIGADGSGSVVGGSFTIENEEETPTWTCFYKCVYNAGDPSINHLMILPGDATSLIHTWDEEASDDLDKLEGTMSDSIHYLLFSTYPSQEENLITLEVLNSIAQEFISNINNSDSIESLLSNLNGNYAQITALIPSIYEFPDDGQELIGLDWPTAVVYTGDSDEFRARFLVSSDGDLYEVKMRDRNVNQGADVTLLRNMPFELTGMACLNGVIYGITNYIPFLIKMDKNGNFLNEIEDNKFDTIVNVPIENLFVTNGQLWGYQNNEYYIIDPQSGNCASQFTRNTYVDICGVGEAPPPVSHWFGQRNDEEGTKFVIQLSEPLSRDIEVQWNPIGYNSDAYGITPTDGWVDTPIETSDNEIILLRNVEDAYPIENITVRVRYISPNSEWFYIYWD